MKKLGPLREGGGWRVHGRGSAEEFRAKRERQSGRIARSTGLEFVHGAVDDHSRLAHCEVLPDEHASISVAFWGRAGVLRSAPHPH